MFDKKILCLGNNSQDTDQRTDTLAEQQQTINHGLITDSTFLPADPGYYHTTVVDISSGDILQLAQHFDQIILLDQPVEEWSHYKPLLSSYKLLAELEQQGKDTVYKNNTNIQNYINFDQLFKENKSFCIYPWIEKVENNGYLNLCNRSQKKITTLHKLTDWKNDPNYQYVRQKMLKGEMLPEYCSYCYDYESKGIESYREFETRDWVSKLNINSVEDLENIVNPYYYEVRLSNKCNLMCRGCDPMFSHLIEKEFKLNDIPIKNKDYKYTKMDIVDIKTLTKDSRVYLAGGEPTIMVDVLAFMRNCIDQGKTDFELTFGTNGFKISSTFLELVNQFTNVNFSVSLDGYGRVNDYWRHGSDWDTIIKNSHLLKSHGHSININTVPGIYNVTNLHLLFEFLDREFPQSTAYLQISYTDFQSAYNHPNSKLVVESMKRCQQTKVYHSDGKSCKTCIDSLYNYYSADPQCDLKLLKEFFEYNDKLDQIRNIRLADYIPELEACRLLID